MTTPLAPTLAELVTNLAARLREQHPDWREGQLHFNALRRVAPDVAGHVTATDADPFYLDARLPAFWAALAEQDSPEPSADSVGPAG